MKRQLFCCTLLCSVLTTHAAAQSGGKTIGRNNASVPRTPTVSNPNLNQPGILLSGKVVVDDGTQLTEGAAIQTICKGERRTEAYSDTHGNFSFTFGRRTSSSMSGGFGDASASGAESPVMTLASQEWRECELQAALPGFTSEVIELRTRMNSYESGDIGQVRMRRMVQVEGFTISATTAVAPDNARKALEKGREQAKKKKWDAAQQSLEKAVQIYPKYAAAWFELGWVQFQKKDLTAAKHSFEQSIAADSHYVNPYEGLAQLAMQRQQWQELADITSKLLALNPVSFTDAWFFNGVGNYNLQNFATAEKSAREGLRLDQEHRIPKLEYLLGMVLLQQHNVPGANEHMQKYLGLTRNPAEMQEAQKQLAEIARLLTTASVSSAGDRR
jgi:tetratricopeptide (TPR) repeat protein